MSNGPEIEATNATGLKVDRRRPGRLANVSPELVPLLRGQAELVPDELFDVEDDDQLRGARGLATGLAISAAVWGIVAYAVYLIF